MTDAPKIPDGPYSQESALKDLPAIKHAEALFLNSQMDEAEAYCLKVDPNKEGLRRPLADLVLLCFHVIISGYTFRGVDLSIAQSIIDWNLRRFPNGVFFLFFSGRLNILRSQPALALQQYNRAFSAGSEHKSLTYIAFWELAIAYLSLWDIPASLEKWRVLEVQATWSKACYLYGVGVCLLQMGGEEKRAEAVKMMEKIEGSLQKVAGKSIPIEKFVARKARKFKSQNRRLLLPALEFSYMFQCISHAPCSVLVSRMLPEVDVALAQLNVYKSEPAAYGVVGGNGMGYYYDDLCLARFLEGVCARHVAFPDRDAIPEPEDDKTASAKLQTDSSSRALAAFEDVLTNSDKIALDHYLIYHTHYEIGRLHACLGNQAKAREHLELVLSGKPLEADPSARKGKYSMQTDLVMRATASLESLDDASMR
ncbi:hypothetical protein BD410DRAFT_796945 [Rickenella mellea]|uniref:Uncharacterized protein n=1 Tax=Rickenella mellea TaxID=50990 RepID=A0A4Y7PJQ7_9AGAM|nr:hypothetical protein BD410DRAFT_796945 [Rickenella mellea]